MPSPIDSVNQSVTSISGVSTTANVIPTSSSSTSTTSIQTDSISNSKQSSPQQVKLDDLTSSSLASPVSIKVEPKYPNNHQLARYLASDTNALVLEALSKLYQIKMNSDFKLTTYSLVLLESVLQMAAAKQNLIDRNTKAELEKLSAQQAALMLTLMSSVLQLIATAISIGGTFINNYMNDPNKIKVSQVVSNNAKPTEQVSHDTPVPEPESPTRNAPFVPGASRQPNSTAPNLEIEVTAIRETETVTAPTRTSPTQSQSSIGKLEVELKAIPSPEDISKKLKLVEQRAKEQVIDLRDRISASLSQFQIIASNAGKIAHQSGQVMMANISTAQAEKQKDIQKTMAAIDAFVEESKNSLKGIQAHSKNARNDISTLINIIKEIAETKKMNSLRLFRG